MSSAIQSSRCCLRARTRPEIRDRELGGNRQSGLRVEHQLAGRRVALIADDRGVGGSPPRLRADRAQTCGPFRSQRSRRTRTRPRRRCCPSRPGRSPEGSASGRTHGRAKSDAAAGSRSSGGKWCPAGAWAPVRRPGESGAGATVVSVTCARAGTAVVTAKQRSECARKWRESVGIEPTRPDVIGSHRF
jgi:hypothetical protein